MASRYSAARPKRDGETYARQHHAVGPDSKKVKFDLRNPSALAPDVDPDEDEGPDAFLEADADVIRGGLTTKRGAVNIDGYDSDSDREELGSLHSSKAKPAKKEDDDMDDMFGDEDDDPKDDTVDDTSGKTSKEVKFLDTANIDGQDSRSKSGGHIRLDDESDDDDNEEARQLAIEAEGVDEEVGLGGLKKNAPKVEAFNLKAEEEEGKFDESGNFVRKAVDPDAIHDKWLEGTSKKDIKKAAEAHEKRESDARAKRKEDDSFLTADLLKALILTLEPGETALEALARLAKGQKKGKKVPKWKQQKNKKSSDVMDTEADKAAEEDPEQIRIKENINAITDAADKLLGRDRPDIYDTERERLIREYTKESDEPWQEPRRKEYTPEAASIATATMWEFRWVDGRDNAPKQGPYDGPTMKAWQDAGYFGEGVEFRQADSDDDWSRTVAFV